MRNQTLSDQDSKEKLDDLEEQLTNYFLAGDHLDEIEKTLFSILEHQRNKLHLIIFSIQQRLMLGE